MRKIAIAGINLLVEKVDEPVARIGALVPPPEELVRLADAVVRARVVGALVAERLKRAPARAERVECHGGRGERQEGEQPHGDRGHHGRVPVGFLPNPSALVAVSGAA